MISCLFLGRFFPFSLFCSFSFVHIIRQAPFDKNCLIKYASPFIEFLQTMLYERFPISLSFELFWRNKDLIVTYKYFYIKFQLSEVCLGFHKVPGSCHGTLTRASWLVLFLCTRSTRANHALFVVGSQSIARGQLCSWGLFCPQKGVEGRVSNRHQSQFIDCTASPTCFWQRTRSCRLLWYFLSPLLHRGLGSHFFHCVFRHLIISSHCSLLFFPVFVCPALIAGLASVPLLLTTLRCLRWKHGL